MTPKEYKQLEELFCKLTIELKHPIYIIQSIHDGWQIGRYNPDGNLLDSKTNYSIESAAKDLIASDVSQRLIRHDIIS